MLAEAYITVFQITDGFDGWSSLTLAFLFACAFIGLLLVSPKKSVPLKSTGSRYPLLVLMFGFGVIVSWLGSYGVVSRYVKACSIYSENRSQFVEGVITDYSPPRDSRSSMESFVVGGVVFVYATNATALGFNNSRRENLAIQNGRKVRIWYTTQLNLRDTENVILRLQVQ
ncbi:hypothetical protein BH09VER1_BH09VER1_09110 [soil metagenome]